MKAVNSEFRSALMRSIDVGEQKAVKIRDLIENRLAGYRKESQESFDSFKKNAYRIITPMLSDDGDGLIRIKKGNAYIYYWSSQEDKDAALEQFEMSEERALAFSFIKEYLPELIPPHIYCSLQTEFKKAEEVLHQSDLTKYFSKIDFNPLGYDIHSQLDHDYISKEQLSAWQFVFDCTFNENCFSCCYESIHENYNAKQLIISPQRIVLLNHQLKVLGYEHSTKSTRYFQITKLSALTKSTESFVELAKTDYESVEKFSAICHSWVKNYFESTSLSTRAKFTPLLTQDCWLMETELSFPVHFNCNEPDPFFVANYLGMFADSILVQQPTFLRKEMQRRANRLANIYNDPANAEKSISSSPHVMAKKL
ncbi:WYL domain-containing protein [Thalassotalea profundi]|nr:WYL domain-containing protein [Thalassotalea profundi]